MTCLACLGIFIGWLGISFYLHPGLEPTVQTFRGTGKMHRLLGQVRKNCKINKKKAIPFSYYIQTTNQILRKKYIL